MPLLQDDPPPEDTILGQLRREAAQSGLKAFTGASQEQAATDELERVRARTVALGKKAWNYAENRPLSLGERLVGPAKVGFWESVAHNWGQKIPFLIGAGKTAYDLSEFHGAALALGEGAATDEQENLVFAHMEWMARAEKSGVPYWAGTILSELPAFAIDFWLTSGVAGVGKGVLKGAGKKAMGQAASEAIERAIAKSAAVRVAARTGDVALHTALQTAISPHTITSTFRAALPQMGLTEDESGRAAIVFEGTTEDFWDAFGEGYLDSLIEHGSERTGPLLGKLPPIAQIRGAQTAIMSAWLKKAPNRQVDGFLKKVARGTQWHGVFEEIGEEFVGDTARAMTGLIGWDQVIPEGDQLIGMVAALSVPGLAGGVVRATGQLTGAEVAAEPEVEDAGISLEEGRKKAAEPQEGGVPRDVTEELGATPLTADVRELTPEVRAEEPAQVGESQVAPEDIADVEGGGIIADPAFHGSAADFEEFSDEFIGTGEGAQAFGYGHYFAGTREVAEFYRDQASPRRTPQVDIAYRSAARSFRDDASTDYEGTLAGLREAYPDAEDQDLIYAAEEAHGKRPGRLYAVELAPAQDEYLLWDEPLSAQSEKVRGILREMVDDPDSPFTGQALSDLRDAMQSFEQDVTTGETIYNLLWAEYDAPVNRGSQAREASAALRAAGIRGIKYREGAGRASGEGNFNYVIFDPKDVEITAKLADPARMPAAASPLQQPSPVGDPAKMPIGARLRGRLAAPPVRKPGQPASAPDVIHALSRVLLAAESKTPIRSGRVPKQMQARGFFDVAPEVIRVKVANNIATAAHEVGHALEKAMLGWPKGGPWKKPLVQRQMQQELLDLGKALYGSRKPAAGYKREGFAEYIRLFVSESEALPEAAPKFHEWFTGQFLADQPAVQSALEKAREVATEWREQGSVRRAQASMIDPASPKERLKEATKGVTVENLERLLIDMAAPLRRFSAEAERRLGYQLAPEQDPFFTLSALRTTHAARTRQMVERAMIDLAGNPVGVPLKDAVALVKGSQRDFTIYLWAQRAKALWEDPRGPRNPGLSLEDANQIIEELDSPRFQRAADMVYEWNDGVLNYAAQASPSFAQVVKNIREVDPGSYIPLQREFKSLDGLWARSGASAQGGSFTKRLRGSGRRIKDPFQSLISNAESTVRKAHQRLVMDQMIKLSEVEGMGHLIVEIPRSQVPAAQADIAEIIDRIRKKTDAEVKVEGMDAEDLIGETLTFFAPSPKASEGDNPILPIWHNGKLHWYEFDEGLYKTLASMDVYRMGRMAELVFGVPAQLFRAGTTGLRASFGLIANPIRDIQTVWVNSRANASGPRLLLEFFKRFGTAGIRAATGGAVEIDPWITAYVRLGGEMGMPLGQDIPQTRRAARVLFQGRVVRTLDPRNVFDFYRDLVQFPELAGRVTEFRLLARDVGWEPGRTMSLGQSLQLLLGGKQVSTDFSAAGSIGRVINRMVPFHNAAIQGPRANIRAFRRNPGKFALRGLALTAASLALWWKYKDEEWWIEMPSREKFLYWHFPVTIAGREEMLRIPRAFEVGAIFAALPEAFADAWYRQDPGAASDWAQQFLEVATPPIMPVIPGELAEQLANRDFFWKMPIVPRSEERRPPEEQYNEYTSLAAIAIGDVFKVSPRRIDHAIRGVMGGVAPDLMQVVGLGPEGQDREDEAADTVLIGRLFQRGGPLGRRQRSVEKLYEALDEATQRQASVKHEETPGEQRVRLMLTDATRAISALSEARSLTEAVEDRRAMQQQILVIAKLALAELESDRPARSELAKQRAKAKYDLEKMKRNPSAATARSEQ